LVGVAFAVVPLAALVVRAPWSQLGHELGGRATGDAARLSLVCSFGAAGMATLLGLPIALTLARVEFLGARTARALVMLPMVLPPVVGGVALLSAFGRRGLLGRPLAALTGLTVPFTVAGAIVAEAFVALPFVVVTAEAGLRAGGTEAEEAAATLGAGPWRRLFTVTIPSSAPALGAAVALGWARALGEFGATITFNGSLPGRTQTLPLAVYAALETDPGAAIGLSLVLLTISILVLVTLRGRWWGGGFR